MAHAKRKTEHHETVGKNAPWDRNDPHPEKAVAKADPEQKAMQADLDRQLKDTFPASDTPSIFHNTDGVGEPRHKKTDKSKP